MPSNVLFKKGTQASFNANINTETPQAQDGVFYLTTDTHRLYVGIDTKPYLLNQTVNIIASLSELENISSGWTTDQQKKDHVHDFYYLTTENILAVWMQDPKDSLYKWIQINPDTNNINNTLEYNSSQSGNVGTITTRLSDNKSHAVTATFGIEVAGGLSVASSTVTNGLLITGNEYSLSRDVSSNNVTVTLSGTNSSTTSGFVLRGGQNITFSETSTNGITISATNNRLSTASFTASNGQLSIEITDDGGRSTSATLSDVGIALDNGNYYAPLTTCAGKTARTLYSAAEIDRKLSGLDGMTYVGTVGNHSQNPTIEYLPTLSNNPDTIPLHNGDVYVVVSDGFAATADIGTVPSGGATVGDLFIAKGTENDNGVITSNLEWTYIPSGNDSLAVASYSAEVTTATNTIEVVNGVGTQLFTLSLTASNGINISTTSSTATEMVSTISHATYTTTPTSSTASSHSSFMAISSISATNGHITGYNVETFTPQTYQFGDNEIASTTVTGYVLNGTRSTSASMANDVIIAHTLKTDQSTYMNSSVIKLSSTSLALSKGNNGEVVMDMAWGSF